MYPSAELTELAARKAVLRARISVDRLRCATLASDAARPIEWIDRLVAQWRRIPPVAKLAILPLGLLLRQTLSPASRANIFGRAMKFAPIVVRAAKLLKARLGKRVQTFR